MGARFSGQVILVAGGTGGLGRAVSQAFLDEEATVVVTYRKHEEFAAVEHAAGMSRERLVGTEVDVTDDAAVGRCVRDLLARYGQLDVLVNTVGTYTGGAPLWQMEAAVLDRLLALNLRAGFVLARAVVPTMLKQHGGTIVNIASRAAVEHAAGAAGYAASKAAALALMDSLAADVKGTGVRVNSVLPSTIDTEANRKAMPTADSAHWPKPEDIARVILFLCSDDAKVIHGAAIPVYGET